ncbi:1,5-anhydro-D-fructose reductase-like [Prorops nasuta]|uniref:1,5-anhydro-D-fructose reductase-like n=1 Tax=Prorops nasuta TaxID=863751 RepID=UPI0034CDAB9E
MSKDFFHVLSEEFFAVILIKVLNYCKPRRMKCIRLLSGHDMPIVGLGTWQAKPEEIETAVSTALKYGYKHIDTAFSYNNEEAIGQSLKKWFHNGGKREQIFITTKLPSYGNRASDVEKYLKLSLQNLGLEYVDMYLVHMPFAFKSDSTGKAVDIDADGKPILDLDSEPISLWKAMEEQVRKGRAKSIGLSNFNKEQVMNIWKNAQIKPSNLQIELHAYFQQKELQNFCKEYKIALTAYSPIGSPGAKAHFQLKYNYSCDNFPNLLNDSIVNKIAEDHKKSVAQILLRHLVQKDIIVIPKSSSPERIKLNVELFDFELTEKEMSAIDALDKGSNGRIFTFLFFKGIEKHPQYPFTSELKQEA